ncbi:hypothetical protein E2C01_037811 [Portunus trituberculatus]|uniref:Uncharacterized protein n=1 Tax=Portunus trituberculatus TaxID=210409 RepID=A0A5B7FF39_PORTR|nr:hypothetical protein [Portunus trituberculatus]
MFIQSFPRCHKFSRTSGSSEGRFNNLDTLGCGNHSLSPSCQARPSCLLPRIKLQRAGGGSCYPISDPSAIVATVAVVRPSYWSHVTVLGSRVRNPPCVVLKAPQEPSLFVVCACGEA